MVDILKNPLTNDGIYYFHNENNFLEGRAIIFGPEDTIYENGIYFFKFKFPSNYPFSPPKLTYLTNNGKTRFNPNLYRNGKVCISLLNTWKGEQWTACQTIRSILLTLVTLFHNKPLLNEPGVTDQHRDFNNYNTIIRYRNFETAILRIINQKLLPTGFVDSFCIIKQHILSKKDIILKKITEEKAKNATPLLVSCGIYSMACKINYETLYDDMSISIANLNN